MDRPAHLGLKKTTPPQTPPIATSSHGYRVFRGLFIEKKRRGSKRERIREYSYENLERMKRLSFSFLEGPFSLFSPSLLPLSLPLSLLRMTTRGSEDMIESRFRSLWLDEYHCAFLRASTTSRWNGKRRGSNE